MHLTVVMWESMYLKEASEGKNGENPFALICFAHLISLGSGKQY